MKTHKFIGSLLALAGCTSPPPERFSDKPIGAPVKIFKYQGDEISEQIVLVNGAPSEDYISVRKGGSIIIYQKAKRAIMPPRNESPIYSVEIIEVDGDRYIIK